MTARPTVKARPLPAGATRPPVPGAARFYTLVPAVIEDAYAWAAASARRRGYEPVELDYMIGVKAGGWVMVEHWVIPATTAAGEAQAS